MRVPLTVADYLDRAEPSTDGGRSCSTSPISPRRRGARSPPRPDGRARPRAGRRARRARRRARRAGRDRLAELGPPAHRVLRRQRVRPSPRADQLPPQRGRGRVHRRALAARRCCSSIPSSTTTCADVAAKHRFVIGAETDAELLPVRRRAASRGTPTRTRPRRSTTRAARPRARRACSSRTATSGSTRTTFGWHMGVNDRDVYLHTLPMFHCNGWGMTYARDRHGRPAHRAAQGRRRRDPAARRRARRHADVRRARGRRTRCSTRRRRGTVRSRDAAACASSSPAHRRRRARSSGSRPSSAGSSSRSTASPRRRRCSR